MDDFVDILPSEALQSLDLDPDFLDAYPLDMTDINDDVYQSSLSIPNIDRESSELQGLGQVGSGPAVPPEFVALLGPDQRLLDVQARYLPTSCDTKHTESNINAPLGGQDNALSPRKRLAPKILVFPNVDGQDKKHQRRRFSDVKRQEVAQVRKDGACMRCHLNKTPCSTGQPCKTCVSQWWSLNKRSTKLQWMGCIPYSWKDVNIFMPDFQFKSIEAWQTCVMLAREETELRFKEVVYWDIDALCTDFATWMTADNAQPAATSRVGILSSMQCQRLLYRYSNDDLCTYLPLLVRPSSLLYNRQDSPHPRYTYEHLSSARSVLGNELLKYLETALKPTSLSKKSKQQLEVLFMAVFGTIIAVVYTCNTESEEARVELIQILTHYLILIGERVGLLQCDMKKLQLTQGCHNLWNKTGDFEWDYDTQSTPNDVAFSALGEYSLASMGSHSSTGSSTGADKSPLAHDHHYVSDPFLSFSTVDDLLPQTDSSIGAAPPAIGDLLPAYDWPGDFEADQSSSPRATEMVTCLLCNQYHVTSDLCSYCFGQPPSVAASNEVTSQNSLDPARQILQSQVPCPDFTKTESFPTYGTKAWSSDGLGSSDLPKSESDPQSSQISRYSFRARTSVASDDLFNIEDNSRLSTSVKGTKRKLTTKGKRVAENKRRKIQNTAKEHKAKLSRPATENPKRTLKRPPLDTSKPRIMCHDQLLLSFACWLCHCQADPTVTDPERAVKCGPARKCQHRQCSHCQISRSEPGFWGRGSWTCCHCQGGPKPTPPFPEICGNLYHEHSSQSLCKSCSRQLV